MKTLIIIPAFNEEKNLPGVVLDLKKNYPYADIVVVNDGSTDSTATAAINSDVPVINLPFNLGIGGAMQAGFMYAKRRGYEIAVQFDGDGQHLASEIEKLILPVMNGKADLAVGSRFLGAGDYRAPILRRIGILIFSKIISAILGMRVTDTTSGFRAANSRVIEYFSRAYPDDYPEVESLVLLHKMGMRIAETPTKMQDRTGGKSSITPLRSAYYMIKVLLAVFVDLLKKAR